MNHNNIRLNKSSKFDKQITDILITKLKCTKTNTRINKSKKRIPDIVTAKNNKEINYNKTTET